MEKTLKKTPDEGSLVAPNQISIHESPQPVNFNAEMLIGKAIEQNISVESLEKLLTMRRDLKAEWAKEQFDKAMAAFQAECPTINKERRVSFGTTNYAYAPLEAIVQQVKSLLAQNGFSYTFDTKEEDKGITVYCMANHISGHMKQSECYIALDEANKMNVSQKSGAAMTYGKRYAFCNAFGILTGDEDNDAQSPKTQYYDPSRPITRDKDSNLHIPIVVTPPKPTKEQLAQIETLMDQKGISGEQVNKWGFTGATMTKAAANLLIDTLKTQPDKKDEFQEIGDSIN